MNKAEALAVYFAEMLAKQDATPEEKKIQALIKAALYGDNLITFIDEASKAFNGYGKIKISHDYNPHLRDFGCDQARNAVRGKPRFLAYVNALYVERCYIGVSKRMKIPIEEVMEIERELLDFLDAV